MKKKLLAETFGTFFLVFVGTGAIVLNDTSGGALGQSGIALTFGLAVTLMIFAIGDLSGAHINPAVTLAFLSMGRMRRGEAWSYVASQVSGAILASLLLRVLFTGHPNLGATQPSGPALQSLALEMALTLLLMLVILRMSTGSKERGSMIGIAVGLVIFLEAFFAGPISGASMNPARSLAPALVSLNLGSLWIYLLGPLAGALAAVPLCRGVCDSNCCAPGLVLRGQV